MKSEELERLLPLIIGLSVAAGEAIMQVYNSGFSVEYKEDNSPLTLADKLSHEIISTGLQKHSSYPVLSEEMAEIPYNERKNWSVFWLVDPLDGTKEFVKRNGEFTVNIALIENEAPVMGFIYLPVHKTLYYSLQNKGAYRVMKGDSIIHFKSGAEIIKASEKLPAEQPKDKIFTIVASRSHNSPDTEAFIEKERSTHGSVNLVSAGSSIKFCLVAEGKADAYPRFAPTMEWDTAAGQAIAEESGKKVVLPDGKTSLSYNKKSLLNPYFMVIS
jgi:3'(2'), 5'-bisphosphate nucleotidase